MMLILSTGMPRSGSTLMFNMLRLILMEKYRDAIQSGWETAFYEDDRVYLIKTHTPSPEQIEKASKIFYTFRDPRVAMVSHLKLFPKELSIEDVGEWISQYYVARENQAYCFKYEEWIPACKKELLETVADLLEIPIDLDCVYEKLEAIQPPTFRGLDYSRETLLFSGHFTHTNKDEWKHVLSPDMQREINEKFADFLEEEDYWEPE